MSDVGARRIEDLERELAEARAEIAALRNERDELVAKLAVPAAHVAPPPLPTISVPPEPTISVPPLPSISLPPEPTISVPPLESELDDFDFEPVSLSGLMVSTPPPAELADDERRSQTRLGCEFEVEFLGDSHLITGLSQDISEGGVFVATYQALPLGSTVTLGLELPGGRVEVKGQVRWARPENEELEQRPGFGVSFSELSPEALTALRAFCRREPPHYYEM